MQQSMGSLDRVFIFFFLFFFKLNICNIILCLQWIYVILFKPRLLLYVTDGRGHMHFLFPVPCKEMILVSRRSSFFPFFFFFQLKISSCYIGRRVKFSRSFRSPHENHTPGPRHRKWWGAPFGLWKFRNVRLHTTQLCLVPTWLLQYCLKFRMTF